MTRPGSLLSLAGIVLLLTVTASGACMNLCIIKEYDNLFILIDFN